MNTNTRTIRGAALLAIAGVFSVTGYVLNKDPDPEGNCHSKSGLPDHSCTPGVVGSKLKLCRQSTKAVRPSIYYTSRLKRKQLHQYAYRDKNPRHYEEDHLVPLALGGAPKDPRNLWPEPRYGKLNAQLKDALEVAQFRAVCFHGGDLKAAQRLFKGNYWRPPSITDPDRDR